MKIELTRDAEHFAAVTEGFLASRIELNVMATTLWQIRRAGFGGGPPLFAYRLDQHGGVGFAAIRTPPWRMTASPLDDAEAEELVELWLEQDPDITGVSAEPGTARSMAAAWEHHSGGRSHVRMSEGLHALAEVLGPERPAPGALRLARASERELMMVWEREFRNDAGIETVPDPGHIVDVRIAEERQFVWDRDGPVSMLITNVPIAGTVRIGAVYTPPTHRRNGYATSAVAAAARRALGSGCERCILFTDLSNPTSNRIYGSIGFRRIGEREEIDFLSA